MKKYAGIILLLLVSLTSFAQKKPALKDSVVKTRILFIFDASQSMWGLMDGETKIAIAQRLLSAAIDSLKNLENKLDHLVPHRLKNVIIFTN